MAEMTPTPPPLYFRVPGEAAVEPGEICNEQGDIQGSPAGKFQTIVTAGVVWVRPEQAERAKAHGWSLHGEWPDHAELVQVVRP